MSLLGCVCNSCISKVMCFLKVFFLGLGIFLTTPVDRNAISPPIIYYYRSRNMYMTPCTVLQNINVSAAFPLVVFQHACEFQLFVLTAPMSEKQFHCDSGLSLCNFHCCCYCCCIFLETFKMQVLNLFYLLAFLKTKLRNPWCDMR